MKNFFNIATSYRFEWNDLRAFTMVVNVALVMLFGFTASWFGLAVAAFGIVKDLTNKDRHINDIAMHLSGVILNCYFLSLLYKGA